MDDSTEGATLDELKRAFDHFFNKGTTLTKIKDAALGDKLFPWDIPSNDSIGISGRSIAWKIFLLAHEPLESSPVRADALVEAMRKTREAYKTLLLEKMRAPDGSYDTDLVLPDTTTTPTTLEKETFLPTITQSRFSGNANRSAVNAVPRRHSKSSLEFNNPLSLHNENPWNAWFASVDLRKTILQDVERTFPDIKYFRRPEVQSQLTNILYLYSVQHPSIGYRQGMHELLAPLYHAVAHDAIIDEHGGDTKADAGLKELCSSIWVAADAWALFEAVMRGVSRWYEWQEPRSNSPPPNSGSKNSPLNKHVRLDVGEGGMRPYVTPIVQACNTIQGTMLRATDPQLFNSIQATGLEPQIYGIRWLRLLFTRELSMPDALRLWDGLFACDPTFDLAQWVCVAMLIRIRNDLIPADYSGQLTLVLRYPTSSNAHNMAHAILILRQALALQMAPNPSTGATIVIENRTVLGIPVEIQASVVSPAHSRRGHLNRQQMGSAPVQGQGHSRLSSSSSVNFETLARGLMERGESLGINKTLMNAVTELKRNIPDLAASLVRPAHQSEVAFPLENERPPQERPPWEPRTRFEIERDVVQLRARDKQIGDSLGWIVDVLLQDEEGTKDEERLKKEKREAIESLAYIRDVLISDDMVLEDDRLFGEEETSRRKARTHRQEETITAGSKAVSLPAPLPVMDTRPKATGHRSRMERGTWFAQPDGNSGGLAGGPALAPWNYTRSSFSESSSLPSSSLPRPPPPTSTRLRRGAERKGDERGGYEDPLGAIHVVHNKY